VMGDRGTVTKQYFAAAGRYNKHRKNETDHDGVKLFNGLNSREAYELEVSILHRLTNTSLLPPDCSADHFPRLLARDDTHMMWQTTWSGTSLEAPSEGRDQFCSLPIAELLRQAECIDSTLQHARVMHLDQHRSGKNLAIWKGSIALFDFDVAVLDNDPKNEILSRSFDIAVGNSNYTVWKIRNIRWKLCQSTPTKESRHRFIPSLLSSETSNVKKGSVGAKKSAHDKNGATGDGSNRKSKQEITEKN